MKKHFILIISLCCQFLFGVFLFDKKLSTGGDNVCYIALCESIISGKGYKEIYKPDEPAAKHFPPGFPFLLTIPHLLFGRNIMAFKIWVFLMGMVSTILFYLILQMIWKKGVNFLLPLFAINPLFLKYHSVILSEVPFIFSSLLFVYLFLKWEKEGRFLYLIFSVFASIFAYYVRSVGIAYFPAILLYLLIRKKYREFLVAFLIIFVLILPWLIRNRYAGGGESYFAQFLWKNPYAPELGRITFLDLLKRIWHNLKMYSGFLMSKILLIGKINTFASLIITGLMIAGFIFTLLKLRKVNILHLILIFYMGVVLIWPEVWTGARFILPVFPFVLYFVSKSVEKIKFGLHILTAIFSIFALIAIFQYSEQVRRPYPPDWISYFDVAKWCKKYTERDAKIMCRKPEFMWFFSDRKAFGYPMTSDHIKMWQAIKKADYIVIDAFRWTMTTYKYLIPAIKDSIEKFKVMYVSPHPKTYLVKYSP